MGCLAVLDQLHYISESSLAHVADLWQGDAEAWLLGHGASKLELAHQLLLLA